jgi:glycosyltransferase involved in cell wall biosynthesis
LKADALAVAVLAPSNSQGLRDMAIGIANALHAAGARTTLVVNTGCDTRGTNTEVISLFSVSKHSPANVIRLLSHFWSHRYDAVHLVSPNLFIMLLLPWVARLRGFSLCFVNHSIGSNWSRPVYNRLRRLLWRRFDGMVLHSKSDVDLLGAVDPNASNYRVIPCGSYGYILQGQAHADLSYLSPEQRAALEAPGFKPLFLGYIRPNKRLDLLLQAVEPLPITLIVAGENHSALSLASGSHVRDRARVVVVNRLLPEPDISYFLERASVVVLPYDDISESGILHLATAAGKPVIASDIPAFRERKVDQFGLLFQKGNAESLRDALLRMQRDLPHYGELARQHASRIVVSDTWLAFGVQLRDYLRELVTGHPMYRRQNQR